MLGQLLHYNTRHFVTYSIGSGFKINSSAFLFTNKSKHAHVYYSSV